jgi:peptidoglycan-N-acetylglucosamine deacetylase
LKLPAIIVLILVAAAAVNFGIPLMLGWWSRFDLRRRTRKAGAVVLTFDDGPSGRLTPTVLHLLAQWNVKATFFMLGRNIPGNESVVCQVRDQGHEVASHGQSHRNMWKTAPWRAIQDVRQGRRAIDLALGGQGTKYLFRPPYGKLDLATQIYLWWTGVSACYWTDDSTDTWIASGIDRRRAAESIRRNKGGVILIHDFERRTPEVAQAVLEIVTEILKTAREEQLKVMTLSELMRQGGGR